MEHIRHSSPQPNVTLIIEASMASGRNTVRGIALYARQHGPWRFHHEWRNTDTYFPSWLKGWSGDGFIARVENPRLAKALRSFHVPIVDVLGTITGTRIPLVHVDDQRIGELAADTFLDKGFSSFAYAGIGTFNWSERRGQAFADRLRSQGGECAMHFWDRGEGRNWSWEREQDRFAAWLQALRKPLGLMLCHDLHGHFVLEACQRHGIGVPDEVAVIAVDDDETICEVTSPPLSSVIPDDERVGFEAARLLDRMLHGEPPPTQPVWIPPRGVHERLSSDVLAVDDPPVALAVKYIRAHAFEGIRVDDVVRHVPLSRSLLQRRFQKALGRTLHDEIFNTRFSHARFLLEQGDMPISDVAEKSGFRHQAYLGAVFKKTLGCTPMEYRNAHRLKD